MGTTRREFLAGAAGLVAAMAAGGCASMSSARPLPKLAYVGCYTSKQRNGRGEGIAVHRIDAATGAWTQLQLVKTADNPSWLTLDRRQRFLYAAHGDGEVVTAFRVDEATGQLGALGTPAAPPAVSRPGAGPRHAAYHPAKPYAYVLNELDSTITTYRFDGERGALTPLQVITTLPSSFTGNNTTSEIVVAASGRFVYASNRGHDSLAIFAVDASSGTLSPVGWEPTQGKTPRFFAIEPSGTVLYAANMDSDTIVAFRVDAGSGKLTPTGQIIKTGSPSSIVFR